MGNRSSKSMEKSPNVSGLNVEFFDGILNSLRDAVIVVDPDGRVLYSNQAGESIFGYTPLEIAGEPLTRVLPCLANQDDTWDTLLDEVKREHSFEGWLQLKIKGGESIQAAVVAVGNFNEDGDLVRWVGAIRELSEQDGASEFQSVTIQFLAASSDLGKYISEGLPLHTLLERFFGSLMLHLDLIGGWIYLLDNTKQNLVLEVHRNLHPDFVFAIKKMSIELGFIQAIVARRNTTALFDVLEPGLKLRDMIREFGYQHAVSIPLYNKESLLGFLNLVPENELGDLEKSLIDSLGAQFALALSNAYLLRDLRESDRKHAMVVEGANDGIMISQDGLFKFVNKRTADMLGYRVSEMIGLDIRETMPPQHVDDLFQHYEARISGRVPHEMYEGFLRTKSGRLIQVEFNASRIQYEGRPASLSFVRDISQRIALQNLVLEQKEMAEFHNDILTHDINNFCQTMLGNIDTLVTELPEDLDKKHLQRLEICKNNVKKISYIIDRVSDLMHIQIIQPENLYPVSLHDLITEAIEITHETYPTQDIHIHLTGPKDAFILGSNLAVLVFLNLLTNAVKHNDKIKKLVEIKVSSTTSNDRPAWRVDVTDNGPGINPKNLDKVFERFKRYSQQEGKGLGLSIVRALVDKLTGYLLISDEQAPSALGGFSATVILPKS